MTDVASLGTINVDRIGRLGAEEAAALADRYGWFPAPGAETYRRDVPDELRSRPYRTAVGGKGANQAVAAARAGADAALFGAVGDDGSDVLGAIGDAGVDVGGVVRRPGPTGTAYVLVDGSGENRIVGVPGANERVDPGYVRDRLGPISAGRYLLLQNGLPRSSLRALLDALDGDPDRPTVIFDPAPPGGAADVLDHPAVDVVTPNESEAAALGPALDAFGGTVVRTRGPDDVIVEADDGFALTPPAVDPRDTTGAGDAFNGYLAARLAAGDDPRGAVEFAAAAAALSTRSPGALASIPTADEVRRFVG